MSRSLALLNARLLPSRPDGADAVLVRDGRIALVGSTPEVSGRLDADAERIELGGRVVCPGFQDAHFHFLQFGRLALRPSLAACDSREAFRAAVDDACRRRPGSDPVLLEAWDESAWRIPERPHRRDLDSVAPDRPVVARRVCGHFAVANGPALAILQARWQGPGLDVAEGHVEEEPALELDELFPPGDEEARDALRAAAQACLALGITTACDFLRARGLAAWGRALLEVEPTVRIAAWVLPECMAPDGSIPGDPGESDRFRVRGLKIFGDGTIGGRTAALFEDYADRPGERGRLLLSADRLGDLVRRAHGAGRPVAIHAIGDRAIATALDVLGARPREENEARGHRLEHVVLPRLEDIDRLVTAGVRPCVQPNFLRWAGPGGLYETALGAVRLAGMNPFRSLLEAGCRPFFGSDGMPASPSLGIRLAMTHPVERERLDRDTAVRLYTEAAATPGFPARGCLAPGEPADLAVFADLPDRLPGLGEADLTLLDGRIVHRRPLEGPPGPW